MKVLVVHNKYLSRYVGGEDIVYKNEFESLKLVLGKENVFSYEVCNDEISKFRLLFSIWFSFKHYRNIKKIVKKHSIDVVHVHNFFPLLSPSVFMAAKSAGAKVIHTLHNFRLWCIAGIIYRDAVGECELCVRKTFPLSGIRYRCYRKSLIQSTLAQLAFGFYKFFNFYRFVDAFFILSESQRKKVLAYGLPPEKIILKENGVNVAKIIPGLKDGYIYVGRLEEAKGVKILLDTWKELDSTYFLTIVGEGECEDIIKKLKLKNVFFLGKRSHEETLNLISKSKYLIQPSLMSETFGLTIIEAMSCGTPVIGFDIGTRTDFIRQDFTGFICQREDLKATILKSATWNQYKEMSENAITFAGQFQNELITLKQVDIYSRLL